MRRHVILNEPIEISLLTSVRAYSERELFLFRTCLNFHQYFFCVLLQQQFILPACLIMACVVKGCAVLHFVMMNKTDSITSRPRVGQVNFGGGESHRDIRGMVVRAKLSNLKLGNY